MNLEGKLTIACLAILSIPSSARAQRGLEADERVSMEKAVEAASISPDGVVTRVVRVAHQRVTLERRNERLFLEIEELTDGPHVPAASGRSQGHRYLYDNGIDNVRVFDREGRELRIPQRSMPMGPHPTDAGFLVTASIEHRSRRNLELFGQHIGYVGRLRRHLASFEKNEREVLIDPATELPVEINVVRDGRLISHETYQYEQLADGRAYIRAHVMEWASPIAPERRTRVTTQHSHLELSRGVR